MLTLGSTVAFSGAVIHGLLQHNCGHVIFPLGSAVIIKEVGTGETTFLRSHTNAVAAIALTADGHLLASGETSPLGIKVRVLSVCLASDTQV